MDVHISLVGRRNLSGEIYRQLRTAILEGRLRPGDLLPPTRELARSLSVSRTTVTVAYDRLTGEGFVTSRVGAGTWVSEHLRAPRGQGRSGREGAIRPRPLWDALVVPTPFVPPARFDFRTGLPDSTLFPYEAWRRLIARQFRPDAAGRGVYGDPAGHRGLREAIVRHLGVARGVQASADEVVITNGTQQALDLLARALLAPGDRVAVEDPGYPPPRWLFESLGARVAGVPVDREGLVVDAIPRHVRCVYVTPSHQYPLGMPMSLARRLALLAWAERHDAVIIEDDYDSEFRFRGQPIEPLQSLDTAGRVAYVGSFSKTLLPTLRLGFVIAPPSLCKAVRKAKFVADWHSPLQVQAALARFIDSGGFARHLRRMGAVYRRRHELVTGILARDFGGRLEVIPSAAGLHVGVIAPGATADRARDLVSRSARLGVAVQELSLFGIAPPARAGLVLGYGAIATGQIAEGLRRLRRCFEEMEAADRSSMPAREEALHPA
ncbi:MAG TPA: PLP-dependent aminotransferase family protein [Gemmatimonadales bacterium]